jgi:hypothetical protein
MARSGKYSPAYESSTTKKVRDRCIESMVHAPRGEMEVAEEAIVMIGILL